MNVRGWIQRFGSWGLILLLGGTACVFSIDYSQAPFQCSKDGDCPSGRKCNKGRCAEVADGGVTCTTDSDCPGTQLCVDKKCQPLDGGPGDTPPSCKSDKDCNGRYCMNGRCLAGGERDPCRKDSHCKDGLSCVDVQGQLLCLRRCQQQKDCPNNRTCVPLSNQESVCAPRCNPLQQRECSQGKGCRLWFEGRGYCVPLNGKPEAGRLCQPQVGCEIGALCRPVKGIPQIYRCAPYCDRKKGCGNRRCLSAGLDKGPIGYCEPIPITVKEGGICGGDLVCDSGLTCKRKPGAPYPRCAR